MAIELTNRLVLALKRSRYGVAAFSIILMASLSAMPVASADVTLGGAQNCDNNAVIYCGASSASQITRNYNSGDGQNTAASIQSIYSYFGIGSAAVQSLASTAVAGSVTSSGNVYVGNQLVATKAITAGRQNIAGSTTVSSGGTTFYTRPPSVSFQNSSLSAYVVQSAGKFQFAILSSCGNPVKATSVAKVTPTAAPKPAAAKPKPSGTCTSISLNQAVDNPRQVSAYVKYTVQNGAALAGITYSWGDGTAIAGGTNTSAAHLYDKDGSYVVKALLIFSGPQIIPNVTCQAEVSVKTGTPVCNDLEISQSGDTATVTSFAATSSTGSTKYTDANINWGDGSNSLGVANAVGQMHTYTNLGNHTVSATAFFAQPGQAQPVSVTGPNCMKPVSFVQPVTPPPAVVTPAAPTATLLNTGPGNIAGLFILVAGIGVFGYRRLLARRLGK